VSVVATVIQPRATPRESACRSFRLCLTCLHVSIRVLFMRKWCHDPLARRRNVKAISALQDARWHLLMTARELFPQAGDIDEDSWRAVKLIDAAIKAAHQEHDRAQREAAR
jgi:hypothetical protein